MDAVILAAGLGTRLRPHTLNTPKPLLTVQGRPILEWSLGALPGSVRRVIVVINYLADQITAYLQRQQQVRDWTTVLQKEPKGTGDALRCCAELVRSDRFLVVNGDDLYGAADLAELAIHPAGLLVKPVDDPRRFGIALLRQDGTVERLVEKPNLQGRHLANIGAYLFPREVFAMAPELSARGEYEITDYVTSLAQTRPVHAVEAKFWLPMGTVEAWQKAQETDLVSELTPKR